MKTTYKLISIIFFLSQFSWSNIIAMEKQFDNDIIYNQEDDTQYEDDIEYLTKSLSKFSIDKIG